MPSRSDGANRHGACALCSSPGISTGVHRAGASASAIGRAWCRPYSAELEHRGRIAIIVMGCTSIGSPGSPADARETRPDGAAGRAVGRLRHGAAFAFGWTPCIGPILAAILAVAASKETVAKGAMLLAVYSAGLGIPFIVAGARGRAVAPLSSRASSAIWRRSRRRWAGCWCSPASRSSPGSSARRATICWNGSRRWGGSGRSSPLPVWGEVDGERQRDGG